MAENHKPEVWLRGPVAGVPPLLQPVAHALLQAREEVNALMADFSELFLWVQPAGMASPGFHLQHIAGVTDRLFTYARGEALSEQQLNYLYSEGKSPEKEYSVNDLVEVFNKRVDAAIAQLSNELESNLTAVRGVGRAQVPSTVIGLYMHTAEHVMRHTGQLLVTVRILNG